MMMMIVIAVHIAVVEAAATTGYFKPSQAQPHKAALDSERVSTSPVPAHLCREEARKSLPKEAPANLETEAQ